MTHQKQLRQVLEHLILTRPEKAEEYVVLRKMLDRGSLTFRWAEYEGKVIKIWSASSYDATKDLVAGIANLGQRAEIFVFIRGAIVFTTDINETAEIRFRHISVVRGVSKPRRRATKGL